MAIINTIAINKKLQNAAQTNRYVGLMKSAANTKLVFAKNELIDEFNCNEVVKEMVDSSLEPSISKSSIVSKGNLTSFIGLAPGQGAEQVKKMETILKNETRMSDSPPQIELKNNRVLYHFKVKLPSQASLEEVTPVGWTTKSWISIIENGISNTLKRFIFWSEGFGTGRSGTGLQSKGKVSNVAELKPTPFLETIFNKFRDRFNN